MFIFRNYTIESLFPKDTRFSGYDDISYVPKDCKKLVWFYQVPLNFDIKKREEQTELIIEKLHLVVSQISTEQTLYVCKLIDMFPLHSIDTNLRLNYIVEKFNKEALQLSRDSANIRFLDVSEYLEKYPSNDWINWKYYFISQMIISPHVSGGFYDWFSKRISQITGTRKKCIVLDLDNTLWGGVLGEDGIEGIKIGGDYPGNAFLYFQESLIELSRQGVILTICSKNNEKDVLEAWDKNPFIKLNKNYISAYRINWNNKADNIRSLSKELNIGLESMVFIDDNPSERELVRNELPMVEVPEFPKQPYNLMPFVKNVTEDYFRVYEITDEDLKKTEQYKANAQRAAEISKFTNIEDFIKSLNIEIDIIPANEFNIPRIAQMSQKTNQFNLTTKRYSEADIYNFVKKGDLIWCISVRDKFGDNGITGAVIITKDENKNYKIDTFFLSCRILGKGIEDAFFKFVLKLIKEKGIQELEAEYIPTNKNSQVADFYDKYKKEDKFNSDEGTVYKIDINKAISIPEYYKINLK